MQDVAVYLESLRGGGPLATALFAVAFLVGNVALVPASVLVIGGGYLLGFWPAALMTLWARPGAALIAYSLARHALRAWVLRQLSSRPRLRALDLALTRGGLRVVLLLRLSPLIPSTASNYALGASGVPVGAFLLGTALGTLPSTLVYASLGSGLGAAIEILAGQRVHHPAEDALFMLGLGATALAAGVIAREARRQLAALLDEAGDADDRRWQ